MTEDWVTRPTAQRPLLTASMAYSTWKRWPLGEKTVMAVSYMKIFQMFFKWYINKLLLNPSKGERTPQILLTKYLPKKLLSNMFQLILATFDHRSHIDTPSFKRNPFTDRHFLFCIAYLLLYHWTFIVWFLLTLSEHETSDWFYFWCWFLSVLLALYLHFWPVYQRSVLKCVRVEFLLLLLPLLLLQKFVHAILLLIELVLSPIFYTLRFSCTRQYWISPLDIPCRKHIGQPFSKMLIKLRKCHRVDVSVSNCAHLLIIIFLSQKLEIQIVVCYELEHL